MSKEEKKDLKTSSSPSDKLDNKNTAKNNQKWTEIHELKVLLLDKKLKVGGDKTHLIEELSKDEDFVQAEIPIGSIKMKLDNIKNLKSDKGLSHISKLNREVFDKYKDYSLEDLEKVIKEQSAQQLNKKDQTEKISGSKQKSEGQVSNSKKEAKKEAKEEAKSESGQEEAKKESKEGAKSESGQEEAKKEAKEEAKSESGQEEAKKEAKEGAKSESGQEEAKKEAKEGAKSESGQEEAKKESKEEAKSESGQEEAKKEAKEGAKSESGQEEAKKESKEEAKSESGQEEAKKEAKEEAKSESGQEEAKKEAKEGAKSESGQEEAKKESKEEAKSESGQEEAKKETKKSSKEPIKLNGLYAFKMSMTRFYNEKGESLPVTALKYESSFVSQIKTKEKDSYSAVQIAFKAQKNKRCTRPIIQHLKKAGFKEGARFIKEIKQDIIDNVQIGDELSIQSLEKGDLVKISSVSKGKGFTGVVKRWNFVGGRASHGSKAHRRTGSIGQGTQPGRVFPGRKMPGRHGFQKVSRLKVPVVEVLPDEGIIFVKGAVPGARNTLVSLQKV